MSRETIVYRAVNKVNGKKYIGVSVDFNRRVLSHFERARSVRKQSAFTNAIRKHGEEAFNFEIVSAWSTRELALQEEVRLIALEKPEYNITKGGDGINIEDRSRFPDWYKKVSAALKGRKRPLDAKSLERAKAVARLRAKKTAVCLNDAKFGRVVDLAIKYGVSQQAIYSVCSGNWFATKGLFFINSESPLPEEECRRLMALKAEHRKARTDLKGVARRRPVVRLNDGRRYESVTAAANANGVSPLRIVQICQGGGMTKLGERFMYADQESPPKSIRKTQEELIDVRKRQLAGAARGRAKQSKPVICLNDGREFVSVSDAARHYGQHLSRVADAIHRNGSSGGLQFRFLEAA